MTERTPISFTISRAKRAQVERIRRLRDRAAGEFDVATLRRRELRVGDPVVIAHHAEDGVAAGAGDVGPLLGRVAIRRADHAGQHRRFVDAQLRGTLVEIEPRRFVDAEHRLAVVVPEVDVVEVDLEDLVLRHARVEQHGQDDLGDLAAPRPLLREEARLDDLLIDRRAARGDAVRAQIREESARHADRIDADVMMKADVLGGEKRVRDVRGNRLQRDRRRDAPVDAVERGHAHRRAARGGDDDRRRAPGMVHELAREPAIQDEEVDAKRFADDEDDDCNGCKPSRKPLHA